jgi:hypothetical protein
VQQDARNGGQSRRSVEAAGTAAPDAEEKVAYMLTVDTL